MEKIKYQRQQIRDFWNQKKSQVQNIRSIDQIYEQFIIFNQTSQFSVPISSSVPLLIPPINKYQFRNFIRKLGYQNSSKK